MEVEANKKDEELQDAEASEDDATELVELEEQSGAETERRKKKGNAPEVDAQKWRPEVELQRWTHQKRQQTQESKKNT